ncbi:MAG: hypothetical protein ABI232_02130 [Jatrophihabitantaceae bacterium]
MSAPPPSDPSVDQSPPGSSAPPPKPDPTPRAGNNAPWLIAVVAAVVAVALAVVLFAFIRPDSNKHHENGNPGFTADESAAMTAASVEAVNILTYTRKSFDADYQRALDGTTGALTSDLQGLKATTLSQMNSKKVDLKADVTDVALETSSEQGMVVLVVANGFTVTDAGVAAPTGVQRVSLTLVNVKGKWLANDIKQAYVE